MYRARIRRIFQGADPQVLVAFWLFGLINNILYVLILSAALDLVGPSVPKSVVLLCDVVPSFIAKLILPYIIQSVPYSVRVCIFVILSTWGMLLVALATGPTTPTTPTKPPSSALNTKPTIWSSLPHPDSSVISTKMAGVILASLSSGAGELSFLGLTHFYGPFALAAWGSGTGGAGLLGAGMYALFTVSFGLSSERTLLVSSALPLVMLVAFFGVLPKGPLKRKKALVKQRSSSVDVSGDENSAHERDPMLGISHEEDGAEDGLLAQSPHTRTSPIVRVERRWLQTFAQNLRRSRSLFIP
ncbi:uncharacterized protein KY384_004598 [Bacidia gigantensis]|uniref:uncharacterized protein n=1 Tax=Bacidia gigantensis TaxID=2732470 RepID=UPI001D054F3A|nr:uncharacterized protein KY384_004598 [Bacidia gigantensis]KAG8531240.1 hypothetical protein KY384_004598 [Bacidia gigantensis]